MVRIHRPRKGSLGYSPRKRASRQTPRFRSFPEGAEPQVQGFIGYKVGMTHVLMIDDRPNSPTEGMEVQRPVTVIETPPMEIRSVKAYEQKHDGLTAITEAQEDDEDDIRKLRDAVARIERVAVTAVADPSSLTGVPKKQADVVELQIAGDAEAALDYALDVLGETVTVGDIFSEGDLVDVAGVTKGKGNQGPVKRWGVKIQGRKAQAKGKGRHIGNLGPWHPTRVRWQVPQQGQTGYHHRTELNKRLLKISDEPEDINPDGGFKNYGLVRGEHLLLKGSIPGPTKRAIGMRKAIRPKELPKEPTVKMVSTTSKQGV